LVAEACPEESGYQVIADIARHQKAGLSATQKNCQNAKIAKGEKALAFSRVA
jgi:hypothetical protein